MFAFKSVAKSPECFFTLILSAGCWLRAGISVYFGSVQLAAVWIPALIDGHILGQTPWLPSARSHHTTLLSTLLISPQHVTFAWLLWRNIFSSNFSFLTHCFKETGDFGRKYHISPPSILRVGMWGWQWMPPWCNIKLENLILSTRSGQVKMIMEM